MAVKWILEAYHSLSREGGKNMVLVPVMVSYDRKYEGGNIAREMISG